MVKTGTTRDGSDTGHVNVNVVSTNRRPAVVTDVIAATEDTPVHVNITTLLGNDSDRDGDSISFVSIQADVPGARSFMRPGGIIEFQPDENVNGTVTFTYEITDGRLTSTGQVQVNFADVNDAPIVVADATATVIEDQVLTVDLAGLIANDVDIEGDSFAVVSVFDGDNGTVQMVSGNAVFTPRANYFGNAGFSYAVRDAFGAESIGYARITVLPEFDVRSGRRCRRGRAEGAAVEDMRWSCADEGDVSVCLQWLLRKGHRSFTSWSHRDARLVAERSAAAPACHDSRRCTVVCVTPS